MKASKAYNPDPPNSRNSFLHPSSKVCPTSSREFPNFAPEIIHMIPYKVESRNLEQLLTEGGDERLLIQAETQKNKYGLHPLDFDGLLCRGSCTANTLNPDSVRDVKAGLKWMQNIGYEKMQSRQIERLYSLLSKNYYDEFDILFAPSGTDLAYVPFLFADILQKNAPVHTFVTCPEELGSGSRLAVKGKFFAERNQFGEKVDQGTPVFPGMKIGSTVFPARNDDGEIIDHEDHLLSTMNSVTNAARLGYLVVGSKSGIEDNLAVIQKADPDVLWTVDLCQLRNSSRLIHQLLDWNCMIMITGSKFYQAPPFCGMMVIPKSLSQKIAEARPDIHPGFLKLFSRENLPYRWSYLRSIFRPHQNRGLLLRWESAIGEMERFDILPKETTQSTIDRWYHFVKGQIDTLPNLELMPHQDQTNSSIISFQLRSKNGQRLDYDTLKQIYQELLSEKIQGLKGGYNRVTIGQPVRYSQGAFLRLALGSYDMRQLIEEKEFQNDRVIIQLLNQRAAQL